MIRAALIGVGGYGRFYLEQLIRLRAEAGIRLVGAVVRRPGEHAKEVERLRAIGCPLFDEPEALYADPGARPNWVLVPTSIPSHAPLTIQALRHGCDVLVEKPAAATVQDVRAMMDAERESGRRVMVGFQNLYTGDVLEIKRQILLGAIGAPRTVRVRAIWPRSDRYFRRNGWAGRLKTEGKLVLDSPAQNAYAHHLNLALFFAGRMAEESAVVASLRAELYRAEDIESFDTFCLQAETKDGVRIGCFATHAADGAVEPEIRLEGEGGTVRWTQEAYAVVRRGETLAEGRDFSVHKARLIMFDRVLEALRDGEVPVCGLAQALEHTRLVNTLHAGFPIRRIPEEHLTRVDTPHGVQTVIRDVHRFIETGFRTGRMFAEAGAAWATPSGACDCEPVREGFPGFFGEDEV